MSTIRDFIGALPGFRGLRFNPLSLIQAANYFQYLGFEAALRLLDEYCRDIGNSGVGAENVLLVLRILFTPKNEGVILPSLDFGQPDVGPPTDPASLPLFPLSIVRDIPFLLVGGYRAGGEAQPPSLYLEWCHRHCNLRPRPLIPDPDVLADIDIFLASNTWRELAVEPWHSSMLRLQALRAVSHAYLVNIQDEEYMLSKLTDMNVWNEYRRAFRALNVTWDPTKNQYQVQ